MELAFQKEAFGWIKPVVQQIQTQEQTQELKLSDGMPDIGRVLGAWGQPVLRSKEWRSDSFSASGGMMVWVLYAPEDGTQPRCCNGWIPWQLEWDLPSGTPEGKLRVSCLPRFVDARSVSPRKLMVRSGVAVLGEAFVDDRGEKYIPPEVPEDVQLLCNTYPMRLAVEVGEKTFQLDEELVLPQSCPTPGKLVSSTIHPEVTDSRVLGSRVLFRGNANLRLRYLSEEGKLFSWEFPVSISQYEDLSGVCSPDARADFRLCPTDLDVSLDDQGRFRLKCSLTAQYTVQDLCLLPAVEDAYSPVRELTAAYTQIPVVPVLEDAGHGLSVQLTIPQEAEGIADVSFLPDFPRQRRAAGAVELEQPASVQVLYYSPEGTLQSAAAKWEGKLALRADPDVLVKAFPSAGITPEAQVTGEGIRLKGQLPLSVQTSAAQEVFVVTGLELGAQKEPDPGRPSLILCRAGEESLWQLARNNGSTVSAIRSATGFEGEPEPGQMLLIPVL